LSIYSAFGERAAPLARHEYAVTIPIVALSASILLVPTFINGYPLIFNDSGTYLRAAVELKPTDDRPVFYSLFILPLHWRISPWPIVIAQAVLVVFMIGLVARTVFGIEQRWIVIPISAVLAAVSSLPWFVGQIMPDIFAAVLILAILLLVMGWDRLAVWERWFVVSLVAACVTFHLANLLIVLSTLPTLVVMYLLGWRPGSDPIKRLIRTAAAVLIAVSALISVNVVARGKFVISASSSTFLLAKLLEDGPALSVLEDECPGAYLLCSQLGRLHAFKKTGGPQSLADYFLWGGPLADLGWFKSEESEAAVVVNKAIKRYWTQQILTSLKNGARQFVTFNVAIDPPPGSFTFPFAAASIQYVFGERSLEAFNRSIQGRGKLDFSAINAIDPFVIALSLGFLGYFAVRYGRSDPLTGQLAAFTLLMLFWHALIIGTFSTLHDRYQSRVVWLFPLVMILLAFRALNLRSETSDQRAVSVR
jgi:hypothetical protein